ncbi:S-layer homology domain-containing protein [Paenibacillus monticola]|uniref:DUF4430 domain-containing protein n=1 Tax=Paenibacillus monticola TaxID=2666075 RepID=A0A7X2L0Q0_9BACL|nr:S-layer homology domain-containing protein [Paenibacillus monticola]MRN51501.1 DUF4430 domain-containing protein [Paenibacillus monticola]
MKNIFSSKLLTLGLALLLVISILGTSLVPAGQVYAEAQQSAVQEGTVSVTAATYAVAEFVLNSGVQTEWQAMGLAQAGYRVPDSYIHSLENQVKTAQGNFSNVTDYARITLAAKAIGADPASFTDKGYNLIEKIYNNDKMSGQTLNNPVYALLALDSGHYTVPGDALWTADKLLTEILSKQNTDGGFTLNTGASDVDMTAMVLTALAAHKDNSAANSAGQRAVAWLSAAQDGNGGFGISSESVSQAIIGLASFGIDPDGADFTKNNIELIGKLLSFRLADGSFAHSQNGSSDVLATQQGLQALVAYNLFNKGGNGKLYDFSNPAVQNPLVYVPLTVEGPEGTLAQGSTYAGNVFEALQKLATEKSLPLVITKDNYVTGIGNVVAGNYGGWDGWSYVVSRAGQWIYPDVGMSGFALQAADRVLIYYGGSDTDVVNSVIISQGQPTEETPFTVTVTKKKWVWNGNTSTSDPVTALAGDVKVQVGTQTVSTDAYGVASFAGLSAGNYSLTITGYRSENVPVVVKYTQALKVAPKNVTASLSVEGPQGPIAAGTLQAANALEALQQLTTLNHIPVDITESSFGSYVSGINGITSGTYDGWWSFVVSRNGEWIYPSVGMDAFKLQESDQVLVYYAGSTTQVVNAVAVSPSQPQPGQPFTVTVTQKQWVWNDTTYTSDPVISSAANVQVSIGGKTETTNAQGVVSFAGGLSANTYTIAVTGYVADRTPTVARYTQSLVVSSPAAATATISVVGDSARGTILNSTKVALNAGDTPYSLLVRQLGNKVTTDGSGSSLYVKAIDGLAEFDRGPLSGWIYFVNGAYQNVSAGAYILSNGDTVNWRYTTNGGTDLGQPAAGSSGTGGSGSGAAVSITVDNTLPLNQVGETTAVTNLSTKMTAAQAAVLGKTLAANTVSVTQEVTSGAPATLTDSTHEVQLQIPAGAVSGPVKITMQEQSSNRSELVSGLYEFTPDGTKFTKPIDLAITVPVTTDFPGNLVVAWLNKTTNQWIPVPSSLDVKTGVITGKVSHFTSYAVIDRSKWEPQQEQLKSDIAAVAKNIAAAGEISAWQALGLARSGNVVPSGFLAGVKEQLIANKGEFRKVTDYERTALAVAASGGDPLNIGGFNLIEKIYNNANMIKQGSNGPIFALIALDSAAYSVPVNAQWNKESLLKWILEQQNTDGGFPLTTGEAGNVDITAMAVAALSAHGEQAGVKAAIDKAINWLSQQQLENGGYKLSGEENSESVAQVIIALSAAGAGPNDSRFVKAKGGLLSNLAAFKKADGGYAHAPADNISNSLATEQVLLALTAYDRSLNGQAKLYSLSSVPTAISVVFADEQQISAWALDAVHAAYDRKLMQGVSGSSLIFAPKENITRAQFAALLLRLTHNTPAAASTAPVFSDVKAGAWYYGDVLKAKELGIIDGISATAFNPNGTITRQDMAVMIARAFKLAGPADAQSFKDEGKISPYASIAVHSVSELGYMTGFNGAFDPSASVTREMAAVVAVRLP